MVGQAQYKTIFRSKNDNEITGRHYTAQGEEFLLLDSEYADNTVVLCLSLIHI